MSSIVNSVAYKGGIRQSDVPIEDISEVLREPDTFVWLGLHEPDEALLRQLQEEFELHELAVEDAHVAHQRPKVEAYRNALFVVLHTAWLEGETIRFGETHFFIGKHFLVSIRHGPSSNYAQVRERVEATPALLSKGPSFAAYAILDFVVDNYLPIVDYFEDRLESLEIDIFHGRADREAIGRLYDLQRQLLSLRRAVAPLREVCAQLMSFQQEFIPAGMSVWFRDVSDHVIHVIEAIDNMLAKLSAAMQVNLAFVAIRQNDAVKKLAGWGAVLAVPTVVFSLYGMNFQFMPELNWTWGYPLILLGTGAGCIALYRMLKRSGWL
jgi:magnesium transporter